MVATAIRRSHVESERASRVSQSAVLGGPSSNLLMDAAGHTRFRRLVAPVFSARRMASLRPLITGIVADLLDVMAHQAQPVDVHDAVSLPLPVLVICELLGVPPADREDFGRWSEDAGHRIDAARSEAGLKHLREYMRALVDRKQGEPDDDVLSDLVAAVTTDPELTVDDIAWIGTLLLFAGDKSTVGVIDRGVALLLSHPEQADALRHDPALIAPAVEEILRFSHRCPSHSRQTTGVFRYANTDFTFGDVTIRTGELVMLGLNPANLDERLFSEPHRFDVHRTPNRHLAFGYGPHFCLGAPLARIELQILFPALLSRFPTLRLAVPVESLRERDELTGGSLAEVPVTW